MAKILFFGDIVGRPGRQALAQILPQLRDEHQPDIVIANVENLAHGKGVTPNTMAELAALGIDAYTSGNHVFDKGDISNQCFELYPTLTRPYNYVGSYPGQGFTRVVKNGQHYLIVSLNGRVFFDKQFRGEIANPFFALDQLLQQEAQKGDIIIVDFHCEATSEMVALGWYADGRITALFGTHTHIPTADYRILPKGTAYVTDVGMTGPQNSVLGAKIDNALNMFLEKDKFRMDVAEEDPVMINAMLVEAAGVQATSIQKIYKEINVSIH
jgi:2',3'-cyclic-nucleotide 2'-phosphodiesterase